MAHTRRVVLTAPIPTVEDVAKRLGLPRRRVERLEPLVESIIARDTRTRRAARVKKKKAAAKRGR